METREKIVEMAKCLGQIIKEDEKIKALNEAQEAYNADPDVLLLTTEYTVQQQLLMEEYANANNKETIDKINARINAIYNQVLETKAYKAYESAQNEVNELMQLVNDTISAQITGQSGGCTHDCSTCGGCH
ncbi:MAG: YlbF family regulator [Clostridia bacterium]|nr:YlbF family regulator [Clostridia bacterium]